MVQYVQNRIFSNLIIYRFQKVAERVRLQPRTMCPRKSSRNHLQSTKRQTFFSLLSRLTKGERSHLFHLIAILRESHICPYSVTVVGIPRSKHVPLCPLARRPKWGAAGARRSWPIWLAELLSQQELLHATCCTSQRPFVINVPFRRSNVTLEWCFTVVEKTAGGVEGQLFGAKHNL